MFNDIYIKAKRLGVHLIYKEHKVYHFISHSYVYDSLLFSFYKTNEMELYRFLYHFTLIFKIFSFSFCFAFCIVKS